LPELPEVETIRRQLEPELLGRRIGRVRVYHDDLILGSGGRARFGRLTRGRFIGVVHRRAKFLLFPLHRHCGNEGEADRVMRVQLRMTGRFWLGRERPDPREFRHPGVELGLDDGRTLFYDDVRRLGGFDVLTIPEWSALEDRLGPEPLLPDFTRRRFAQRLAPLRTPIKNALLDQRRIAGVGNIYASEALYRARINPFKPAGTLTPGEIDRLHRAIRRVLREALTAAGTTLKDYRTLDGRSGSFQTRLRVYGRAEVPCQRCGTRVVRAVQGGRSTFYCPECQA